MINRWLLPALSVAAALTTGAPMAAAQAYANPDNTLRAMLQRGADAFNHGDFAGYLADFAQEVHYNELTVKKPQLVALNTDLKQTFANLQVRYSDINVRALGPNEALVGSVAEFTGSTPNYEQSGMPGSYVESGEVRALYRFDGRAWQTNELHVAWNDSTIAVGETFGVIGLTTLPNLVGASQPYNERLWVGDDARPGVEVDEAYAIMPLTAAIDKAAADQAFKGLKFQPVPTGGLNIEMHAPEKTGTYIHLVVLNKFARMGDADTPLGQKIFTRLVHVE